MRSKVRDLNPEEADEFWTEFDKDAWKVFCQGEENWVGISPEDLSCRIISLDELRSFLQGRKVGREEASFYLSKALQRICSGGARINSGGELFLVKWIVIEFMPPGQARELIRANWVWYVILLASESDLEIERPFGSSGGNQNEGEYLVLREVAIETL